MKEVPMRTQQPDRASSRRPWATLRAGAVLIAVIAVGAWVVTGCGDSGEDSLTTATELADTWAEGWSYNDPEAVTSVFADDGVYIDVYGSRTVTKADMPAFVDRFDEAIANVERLSDLTMADAGTYTWEIEWDHESVAQAWVRERGVARIELDGDLASRIEVLEFEVIEVLE